MNRLLASAVLLALATGCGIHVHDPGQEREDMRAHQDAERERRAVVRAESRQREADLTASIRSNHERVTGNQLQAQDQRRADRIEAERQACSESRPDRLAQREAHEKALAHRDELREWEATHCKWVDRSIPVMRQVQDAQGVYHTVEGRSEAVNRECNAKLPKELEHIAAGDIFIPQPTYAMGCEAFDREAAR